MENRPLIFCTADLCAFTLATGKKRAAPLVHNGELLSHCSSSLQNLHFGGERVQTTIDETDCRKFYRLLAHQTSTEIRLIDPTRVKPPISKFVRSETEFLAELKNPVNYGGCHGRSIVG